MTSAGGHGLWSGRVLEAAAAVARQHLQAGLDQPRPLHRALLQPLPHLQVPPRPRRQGEPAINQDIDIDIAYLIPGKVRADLSPLPEICRSDSSDICAGVLCEVKTVKKCIVDIRKIFIYCAQHCDNAVVGAVPHDPVARLLLPVHLHLHPGAR